jgi:hypothetical protein
MVLLIFVQPGLGSVLWSSRSRSLPARISMPFFKSRQSLKYRLALHAPATARISSLETRILATDLTVYLKSLLVAAASPCSSPAALDIVIYVGY